MRLLLLFLFPYFLFAANARIKDLADLESSRQISLIGYGLVVGLDGSGDRVNSQRGSVFTVQAIANMLENFGIKTEQRMLRTRNVAAVMVTANTPPFGRQGSKFDVIVSSLGDAVSLEGGVLLMTPLRDLQGNNYALAQGAVSIGGFNVEMDSGEKYRKNYALVGRVPNGASLNTDLESGGFKADDKLRFIVRESDVSTAIRIAEAINTQMNAQIAEALDPSTIEVSYPTAIGSAWQAMQFVGEIEALTVESDQRAKVIINERTGTVVVGGQVTLSEVMISHGAISIHTYETPIISQPVGSAGSTATASKSTIEVFESGGSIGVIPGTSTVSEIASAMTRLGLKPRDIIAVFQAIKAAGALNAELVIL